MVQSRHKNCTVTVQWLQESGSLIVMRCSSAAYFVFFCGITSISGSAGLLLQLRSSTLSLSLLNVKFSNPDGIIFQIITSNFYMLQYLQKQSLGVTFDVALILWFIDYFICSTTHEQPSGFKKVIFRSVLPQIMNFGRIQILYNICIFKNDKFEYEYYLEFEKIFKYYSWEILEKLD